MRNLLITAILAIVSIVSVNAQTKVGVVDYIKIAEQLPEAVKFDKEIKELQKKIQDTIQMRNQQLQAKGAELQKQMTMMTEEMKQQKYVELQQEQMDIQRYGKEQEQMLMQRNNEFMVPFRERIIEAIEQVAKKEKINVVMDKTQLFYSDEALDITFTVIDKLKRGAN